MKIIEIEEFKVGNIIEGSPVYKEIGGSPLPYIEYKKKFKIVQVSKQLIVLHSINIPMEEWVITKYDLIEVIVENHWKVSPPSLLVQNVIDKGSFEKGLIL